MAEYIISEKALEDLNNIWIYTAENWSVEQQSIHQSHCNICRNWLLQTASNHLVQPKLFIIVI